MSSGAIAALINILAGNSKQKWVGLPFVVQICFLQLVRFCKKKKENIMLFSSLFNVSLPNGILINVYDII